MTDTDEQKITDSYSFEGDAITGFMAQIPSTRMQVDEQWPRGSVLNMNLTLRVRSVKIEEDRKGNLIRHHLLAVDEAQVRSVLTPAQRRAEHDAAVAAAAQDATQADPVIAEHPAATEEETDWSDVEAKDAEKRGEAVAQETDADQFEQAADLETVSF